MAKVLCVRARHTAQQLAAALDRPEGLSVRARSVLDSQAASE
jgi:hypothetical protein